MDFDTIEPITRMEFTRLSGAARFRKHYHSGRYERSESSHGGDHNHRRLLDRPICAIDGEGADDTTGKHHYRELRGVWPADRRELIGPSLGTTECLEYILSLPADHTIVGYALSYDMNMWLRGNDYDGLHHNAIDHLLDNSKVMWGDYTIHWIERKYLWVKRGNQSRTVYDVFANFQKSFVVTCEAWEIGTPAQLDFVRYMKAQRQHLGDLPPEQVAEYNWLECELLAELCRKFFDAIKATDYRPNAVYGPGALASAAMTKHGVKQYMPTEELLASLGDIPLRAYAAGRFDTAMLGAFTDVWQYDIKSAYPDQIRDLPCLRHAEYVPWKGEQLERFSLYHVDWKVPEDSPWPPFPLRTEAGDIWYPTTGAKWVYGDELSAAIGLFGMECFTITEGRRLIRHCSHVPFHFVEPLYKLRQSMPYGQGIVIKLVLNSLYGKTAQQVGGRNGKPPPFQCFPWAGMITAGTRAKILRGLTQNPEAVIGIATDSLVALRELDLPVGENLGEWEVKRLTEFYQVSNGVNHGINAKGEKVERSRGFERSTMDWQACMKAYADTRGLGKFHFTQKATFTSLRDARQHKDREWYACRWLIEERMLSFRPARRWIGPYSAERNQRIAEPFRHSDIDLPRESAPFRVKTDSAEVEELRSRYYARPED